MKRDKTTVGRQMIQWAKLHMPVLSQIMSHFSRTKPLRGLQIGAALHVEAKTAVLMKTLIEGGAKVAITGCNPLSTKDEVATALAGEGAQVFAKRGESKQEYYKNLNRVLATKPDILIDDGGDLIVLAHKKPKLITQILGASEETTTGVIRLKAMERDRVLRIPVIAVNDSPGKRYFDNRFGTAESTLQALMSITNTQISGKKVVVIGFGFVGRGIASRARGLGARVVVVESDPVKALEATFEGFEVLPMRNAARVGDIFITATGSYHVIRKEHFRIMKDKAILCNAGHFNVEIDIGGLAQISKKRRKIMEDVEEFTLRNGRRLYLLTEGRLVNLAGRRSLGHPIEIMDLSFSLQALSVEYLAKYGSQMEPGVYNVPPEIDRKVVTLKLKAMGVELEPLTPEQQEYQRSWEMGT